MNQVTQLNPIPNSGQPQNSRDFTLNKTKALNKKLDATRSEHLSYKITGGGLRLFFSAASFEVFKHACKFYYEQLKEDQNREVAFIPITDKSKVNVVEEQIKVNESSYDSLGRSIKRKCFCINIYYTTSSVLVNGRKLQTFCETDLPLIIVKMKECKIDGQTVNFNELNKIFEEIILLEKNEKGEENENKELSNVICSTTPHLNTPCSSKCIKDSAYLIQSSATNSDDILSAVTNLKDIIIELKDKID